MSRSCTAAWTMLGVSCLVAAAQAQPHAATGISGIHPHLAMDSVEGECGTGAVVPWAGGLWVVVGARVQA